MYVCIEAQATIATAVLKTTILVEVHYTSNY